MANSGNHSATIQGHLEPCGYQQISSLAAATALTWPNQAKLAMVQPETKDVRWRDDGTDPTAAIGMILVANDILVYTGTAAIKFIEVAASGKLNITYYR